MKDFLFIYLILACLPAFSQDPAFTQYNQAHFYLNPGLAGANGCGKAAAGFRDQWPALSGGYRTFYASYDHYLHRMRGGLGTYYLHDRTPGDIFITDRAALVYSAHLGLLDDKLVIKPGVEIAYMMKTLNCDKLTFGDQIDPRRGFIYNSIEQVQGPVKRKNIDVSSGFFAYSKYIYGGFAVHHITEPDEGIFGVSRLPRKFTAHAGGIIASDSAARFTFYPHVLYIRQQDFQQLVGGVAMRYKHLICGLAYRAGDAAIIQLGYQGPLFSAAYSYDNTISSLTNASGGAHELMLSFNILHKKEKKIVEFPGSRFESQVTS